jgi:DNA adenine methylase
MKQFKQKSGYTRHMNRKTTCVEKNVFIETPESNFENIRENELVRNISIPEKIRIPKPILKWVGGKTQILDKLIADFPREINNYHEIFLGGGSVLFTLLSYIKSGIIILTGKIYAYDLNEPLIYVYKNIQSQHDSLYEEIQILIRELNECGNGEINRNPENIETAKLTKENYYYWIRKQYNHLSPENKKTARGSAMFIFLNKTCFRGVFRIGPNGFNVPYGHYENPEIINRQHLDEIHELIQTVMFECSDFNASLANIDTNDFVYLDPPYAPETANSFVGYTEKGFTLENHTALFKHIHNLTEEHKKMMMSNADVEFVRNHFKDVKYIILSIMCKRTIHSKKPESKSREIIVKNY